jgi:DNA-binding MarR family transcriptional regulator
VDDEAIEDLKIALGRIVRRLRAEKADDQLGDTHSSVLILLTREGPRTLRELSDHARVTPPSMNQTINSLAAAGLVSRQEDPTDRRKVLLVATRAGKAFANETSRRRHEWLSQQLEGLSDVDSKALIRTTRILRQIADG